jgi:hypothetical protein
MCSFVQLGCCVLKDAWRSGGAYFADDLLYVGIKKDFCCIRVYIYHITLL